MDESDGFIDICKLSIGCGGNAVARHEILGKGLGALKLSSRSGGAETSKASRSESVNDTGYQWCLGADDGQTNLLVTGKSN